MVKVFMTLMQVADKLKVNKRIGLATTEDGSYIYVCPGHKAKYGFWKGESTIDKTKTHYSVLLYGTQNPQ